MELSTSLTIHESFAVRNQTFLAVALWACCLMTTARAQQLVHGELLFVAPDIYSPGTAGGDRKASSTDADELFARSRQACETGDVGMALQWATRAVHENPEHADARRVLGYRRIDDQWAGNYAARRLERDEVWDRRYGWVRPAELSRWDAGERPLGKRWITAEEDAKRHAKIDDGWQLRTDHFLVVTDDSLAAAADLATRLETLYQIWQQMFGGFYLDQAALTKRFEGQDTSGYRSEPFRVNYYRSRDEYNETLRLKQPQIGRTLGIYFDRDHSSHFFAGPGQDPGTIYHEAVHQFFQESQPAARSVGALCNAWLIEGIACYFESLSMHDDEAIGSFYSLGTPGAGRLPAARQRLLEDNFYVPLAELCALGVTDLQRRSDLPQIYSQSAGLATFLVHGRDGAYRSALVELLQAIYAGHDKPNSLAELTGRSFAELDAEYREFLESLP